MSLAVCIAEGGKVAAWARANGRSQRNAYRLASRPSVRGKVEEIRGRLLDEAAGHLYRIADDAVGTLHELTAVDRPDTIRLQAARALHGSLIDVGNYLDLKRKFVELEKRLDGLAGGKGAK